MKIISIKLSSFWTVNFENLTTLIIRGICAIVSSLGDSEERILTTTFENLNNIYIRSFSKWPVCCIFQLKNLYQPLAIINFLLLNFQITLSILNQLKWKFVYVLVGENIALGDILKYILNNTERVCVTGLKKIPVDASELNSFYSTVKKGDF